MLGCQVRIEAGVVRGPAVPVAALVRLEGQQGVYVLRDGRKVFQAVRIAASDGVKRRGQGTSSQFYGDDLRDLQGAIYQGITQIRF